ncbi:MAG: long-chain fatty acid--CoA ligase [Chloroflexi bacterium]|nr:long-chain fatty acid--CoA ligase [Chloroflexota bacterium]
MSLNLATLLIESAKRNPTKVAVILDEFRLTYAELHAESNKFANLLTQAGVRKGDKVAMLLPNLPQFLICYYGILKTGATVVTLNVLLKAGEIAYRLEDSEAVALITWEPFVDQALPAFQQVDTCRNLFFVNAATSTSQPEGEGIKNFNALMRDAWPTFDLVQTMPEDTAVFLYSGSTSGQAKAAELTHFNLLFNVRVIVDELGFSFVSNEVVLAALPLFHSFGQTAVMNTAISLGQTITLMPRFDPVKAFRIIERDKVTKFAGVPTMYLYLINHPDRTRYDLSSLHECISGGAALTVELFQAWEKAFGFKILEGFGLSETSPVASFNIRSRSPKPGSIGVPVWGVEMKIADDLDNEVPVGDAGELLIRGHNVMKGYYKRPELNAEVMRNGWFHSGDLARMDEEGYFYIVGRKKDMILRGGFNIYAREIEDLVCSHPAVLECAVFGVADEMLGEEVKAVVVSKPGQTITEKEISKYCRERVASYKYPRYVEIRSEPLPRNDKGQILKQQLKG